MAASVRLYLLLLLLCIIVTVTVIVIIDVTVIVIVIVAVNVIVIVAHLQENITWYHNWIMISLGMVINILRQANIRSQSHLTKLSTHICHVTIDSWRQHITCIGLHIMYATCGPHCNEMYICVWLEDYILYIVLPLKQIMPNAKHDETNFIMDDSRQHLNVMNIS